MRKRIASIVLSVCLCFTLLPTAALADDEGGTAPQGDTDSTNYYEIDTINETGEDGSKNNTESGTAQNSIVSYRDYDAKTKSWSIENCTDYTIVTDSDNAVTWGSGENDTWYVVPKDATVTIAGAVTFDGDVHLILCDGSNLSVTGGITYRSGTESNLTIYAQSTGNNMGKLTATGAEASLNLFLGTLTINGGTVEATGANSSETEFYLSYSYGIYAQNLAVNGGSISGTGGEAYSSYGIDITDSFTVSGGTIKGIDNGLTNADGWDIYILDSFDISGGVFDGDVKLNSSSSGTIFAGTFNKKIIADTSDDPITKYLADGYVFRKTDETTPLLWNDVKIAKTVENVTVEKHTTHAPGTDGNCLYCGKPLVRLNDSTYYIDLNAAIADATANDIITLLADMTGDFTCASKSFTLDLNGKTLSKLTVSGTAIKVKDGVGGGKIETLSTSGGVNIFDLLESGHGFKSGSTWYDKYNNSTTTSITNAEVEPVPITSVTLTTNSVDGTNVYAYSDEVKLTATITTTSTAGGEYAWYDGDNAVDNLNEGNELRKSHTITKTNLSVGEHSFYVKVTTDDYTLPSEKITVTINKATPTVTTAPTAAVTYGDTVKDTDISGGAMSVGATKVNGSFVWKNVTSYGDATNGTPKTLTATFTPTDTTNYNSVDVEVPITIARKPVTPTVTVSQSGIVYDGTAKTPAVTVKDGETTIAASEYEVTYSNNTNAGKATVTVTDKTGGNYAIGTAGTTFDIGKAKLPAPTFGTISESGKKLSDVTVNKDGKADTFSWDKGDDTEVKRGESYAWTLTPTDTDNYDTLTGSYTPWPAPSSGGGGSSNSGTTVKNPDGSTTTTVTDKKTGTVTETTTTPNGTTSTTVTDKNGNSTTTVSVSKKDAQSGETITLPVDEVTAAGNSENATEITVNVPSGGATVEIPVKNPTAGTVIVIVDKDGNETIVPTTKLTENGVSVTLTEDATIKVIENSKDFSDVKSSDYFDKAVDWASSRGITGGNSATTFGPHDSCTRAQLVTFLWRAAGQPEAKSESGMSDVATNAYYTDAVAWAFENGIVGGYGNGQFGSDDTITREQMAVILYRFAQHTGMDTTQGGMSVREYKDYDSISDYAVTAIQWAVNAGVMQGYDGNLMPGQPCTRAQIVTMLYRLLGE